MKKWIFLTFLFAACLVFTSCGGNAGNSDNTEVEVVDTAQFTREEIGTAVNAVKSQFKDFKKCELLRLTYQEASSSATGNIIVFNSEFYVSPEGGVDDGLQPDHTYTNWSWTLTRENENSGWTVDGWGQG